MVVGITQSYGSSPFISEDELGRTYKDVIEVEAKILDEYELILVESNDTVTIRLEHNNGLNGIHLELKKHE